MKNFLNLKTPLMVVVACCLLGGILTFTSANLQPDDSEKIKLLEETITEMKAEMEAPEYYDPFIGEISMFGGNFAPRGWALCDGQLLPISQYSALFSILGTTYGGDGRTTFALPDLRGRAPIHAGRGPGLDEVKLGQKLGAAQLGSPRATKKSVDDRAFQNAGSSSVITGVSGETNTNYQPSLSVNYIIALTGTFPSRN